MKESKKKEAINQRAPVRSRETSRTKQGKGKKRRTDSSAHNFKGKKILGGNVLRAASGETNDRKKKGVTGEIVRRV